MRLAKYLANSGITSRRKAEALISEGRIKVNGLLVTQQGIKIDPDNDVIECDGKRVEGKKHIYLLLNKPSGYISSVTDPHGRPTVVELLRNIEKRIYPVGRLDFDTEGLLILTNDGDFTNLMIHPRYEIPKTYEVLVEGIVSRASLNKLRNGIMLEDGPTSPAQVEIIKKGSRETCLSLRIHEGRKRQVKRMFSAVNHRVIHLKRTKFAFLTTQGLNLGEYRQLTNDEVNELIKLAQVTSRA